MIIGPTHSTRDAAQSRLDMALEWGDILQDQDPRVACIRRPGGRPRYAIAVRA